MRQTHWSMLALAVILTFAGVAAQAMPEAAYFCQDDFIMTFGELGQPLSVGTTIEGDGRLLFVNQNKLAGWFTFSATVSYAGQSNNGMWRLDFDTGTFKITSKPTGGTVYWSGTIDNLTFIGYDDPNMRYSAADYPRPIFETEPTEFLSVGKAKFTRLDGTWTDPELFLDWIGSYNWNYDEDTLEQSTNIFGNLQARLVVPEPSGIVALACGLVGLVGIYRKRSS